jgi:hypothetical protein
MPAGVMLGGRSLVVDLDAELGGVAKERPEFGRDPRVIGPAESRRGEHGRRGGRKELNDEGERNEPSRQGRLERRQARPRSPFR